MELLRKARRRLPDLIILDATLPDMDVATVCDILRCLPSTGSVPRLRLAAGGEGFWEVAASRDAKDDRLALPFDSQELLGQVNAMLEMAALAPVEMAGEDAA